LQFTRSSCFGAHHPWCPTHPCHALVSGKTHGRGRVPDADRPANAWAEKGRMRPKRPGTHALRRSCPTSALVRAALDLEICAGRNVRLRNPTPRGPSRATSPAVFRPDGLAQSGLIPFGQRACKTDMPRRDVHATSRPKPVLRSARDIAETDPVAQTIPGSLKTVRHFLYTSWRGGLPSGQILLPNPMRSRCFAATGPGPAGERTTVTPHVPGEENQ